MSQENFEVPQVDDAKDEDNEKSSPGNGAVYTQKDLSLSGDEGEKAPLKGANADAQDVEVHITSDKEEFGCLTKEELEKYAKDPAWRKARIILFVLFWLLWIGLLVAAVIIIIRTPKCPERPDLVWYEKSSMYKIFPRSFKDTDGDGIGDIKGIEDSLGYIQDDVKSDIVWLNPVFDSPAKDAGYDVSNYKNVSSDIGKLSDFDSLVGSLQKRGMKLVLDLVITHTSIEHPWFKASQEDKDDFGDFYIWEDQAGPGQSKYGVNKPAWTLDKAKNKYYRHTYSEFQPDLNLENPAVLNKLKSAMQFWLDRGVDGFNLHGVADIQATGGGVNSKTAETVLKEFQELKKDYEKGWGNEILLMVEPGTGPLDARYGQADLLVRSNLVELPRSCSQLSDAGCQFQIDTLRNASDAVAWQISHENKRVNASSIDSLGVLQFVLRGTPVIYYGVELGLPSQKVPFSKRRDEVSGDDAREYDRLGRDSARLPMAWSNAPNAGFSDHARTWLPVADNTEKLNVAARKASGSVSDKLLDMFKKLGALRSEPSILWGTSKFHVVGDVLLVTRKADGFPGYVAAINFGGYKYFSISDAAGVPAKGEVVLTAGGAERSFKVSEKISLDNLVLGELYVIIAKFE